MSLLNDTETTEFESFYKRLLRERFGNTMVAPADELSFCRELKLGAQAGDVPHGGEMHHVVPAQIDYTEEATIAAIRRPTGLSVAQLALLVTLALAFAVYVLVTVTGLNKPASIGQSAPAVSGSPTPGVAGSAAQGTATASPTSLPVPTVVAGFVTVAGEKLPAIRPNTLELGGRSFLVYVAPVRDGNWYVRQEPGIANWVPGSIINWSFALYVDSDPSAKAWLERLRPGSVATLRTADGRATRFDISEKREINRSQIEFLDPHRPGLTVVIKSQPGDSRLLVQGTELPETRGEEAPTPVVGP
jgi:hypothetical protein